VIANVREKTPKDRPGLNERLRSHEDMLRHYRPRVNVLDRPTGGGGIEILGHHEILIPLLHAGVLAGLH